MLFSIEIEQKVLWFLFRIIAWRYLHPYIRFSSLIEIEWIRKKLEKNRVVEGWKRFGLSVCLMPAMGLYSFSFDCAIRWGFTLLREWLNIALWCVVLLLCYCSIYFENIGSVHWWCMRYAFKKIFKFANEKRKSLSFLLILKWAAACESI